MASVARSGELYASKSRLSDLKWAVVSVGVTTILLGACRRETSTPADRERKLVAAAAAAIAAVPGATGAQIVAAMQLQVGSPVQPAVAQSLQSVTAGLRPQFAAADLAGESKPANVLFPQTASASMHLEDKTTGDGVDVSLPAAQAVSAQSVGGYVVYPAALGVGASVLHRALPSGTEDFVYMSTRPARAEVDYRVSIGTGIAGLRLVGGVLEFLDQTGTPQLHVSPPVIVGADGTPTDGALAVSGCAFDADPSPPWGRAVTAPGATACTVAVTWPDASVSYPAILDPRWTTTGSMATARIEHTLILLSTGKALAVGGRSSTTSTTGLASAELYDRTSGTWSPTGSLAHGRRLHTATQLNTSSNGTTSGKVLVAGGISGTTSMNTAELYSASAGTWVAAGNMDVLRHGHTATLLADGRVLAAGGLNGTTTLATASLYNPASGAGTWVATTGPIPPPGLKNHTATLIQTTNNQLNNHVLLVGGNNGTTTISAVYLFDPVQNAFSTLASLSSPREQHTAMTLQNANGKILVAGGKNGSTVLSSATIFDPSVSNGTWLSAGTMTTPRVGHTMTLLPNTIVANGQVLVAGGTSNGTTVLPSAELFSGTATWTTTPSMPGPLQGHQAVLLSGNMILATGGLSSSTPVQNAAYLYDASFGLACSSNSQCASGFCANGVCCDTACNGGTCAACNLAGHLGTCTAQPSGTVCRAASGACDVAETCNGSSFACPADGVQPLGSVCRGTAGACDVPETCDGTTKSCPADQLAPPTTLCRASTGTCDAPEFCTGTSSACPNDAFEPATTVCRPPSGGCDVAETCTGTSAVCPPDTLASAGAVCRPAVSLCDVAETCSGTSAACPADAFGPAGTTCGSGSPAPVCSGSSGTCPVSGTTSDVLGFEALADWAFASGASASVVGLNSSRTQGSNSFEIAVQGSAQLNSAPVSSIGAVSPIILLDIQLPTNQANPSAYGDVQMFVNSPSLGVNQVPLGDVPLTGLALGTWQTLAFQIPSATASAIAHGIYSDLTFSIVLNVNASESGHYLLDNIRTLPDVVPSVLGVAHEGAKTLAIFDYVTSSSVPVTIPYGTANGLSNQNQLIASPTEVPPTTFVSATHAPFVATMTGAQLTWLLGGHSATATPGSQQLPVTSNGDGTNDAMLPDGRKVNLDTPPPANAARAAAPPVGAAFNGVVPGHFSVSPSGAAVYTVPISVPPGIGGMAPHLALVYNSQSGDGIAGEGWSLSGLSAITRCPRTRQQDGYGRAVMLDLLDGPNPDGRTDGICLDGGKLLEQPAGSPNCAPSSQGVCYASEQQDFSSITRTPTGEFQVVTKAGETRHYGLQPADQVTGSGQTAVWLLDRVVDAWGNYFDIQYNNGLGNDPPTDVANSFLTTGVWVSEIGYTGKLGGNSRLPFAAMNFVYQARSKVRWTRYGSLAIPETQLLKEITTDAGKYSLTYQQGPSLTSELTSIGYCAGSACMQPLSFGWKNGIEGDWPPAPAFTLPSSIVGTGKGLKGTQFFDIDGDGRSDFVLARANGINGKGQAQSSTLLNTGSTWSAPLTAANQIFPVYLSDLDDKPTGVRMADMDGDGRLDIVVDFANVVCSGSGSQAVCNSCPVGVGPGQPGCMNPTPYRPAVWLNKFSPGGTGGWEFHGEYQGIFISFTDPATPWTVADFDGDGKADLAEAVGDDVNGSSIISAFYRNGTWVQHQQSLHVQNFGTPFDIQDFNRDGLTDIAHNGYFSYSGGTIASTNFVVMVQGVDANNQLILAPPIDNPAPSGGTPVSVTTPPRFADIDGDGFYDLVDFFYSSSSAGHGAALGFGNGTGYAFGDDARSGPYRQVLNAFSPDYNDPNPTIDGGVTQDFGFALVDVDGDGLVDLVRNHWQRTPGTLSPPQTGGGEVLLNTGTTWKAVDGVTKWQLSVGAGRIPAAVPSEVTSAAGSAFVDLDGDGLQDIVQAEYGDSNLPPGAWLNPYARAMINNFPTGSATNDPNGYVAPMTITYESTASSEGASTYADDDTTDANTRPLAFPLNVVSTVLAEDRSGTGAQSTTTYKYHSLRQDSFGRGPLGFHRVEAFDQASQVRTVTTYAQAYPYTGMPIEVDKYQVVGSQAHQISKTTTTYCDTVDVAPGLGCGSISAGSNPPSTTTFNAQPGAGVVPVPPGATTFVYPSTITDIAYLHPENDDLADTVTTTSTFLYDRYGNSTDTKTAIARVEGGVSEEFDRTVQNTYTTPDEQQEGRPDSTTVIGVGGTKETVHTTTFEYVPASTFGGLSSRLALSKKHVEPNAGWPVQLDTAYRYDQFGNITVTTDCASDFGSCAAGVPNPSNPDGSGDSFHHPQFRTTTVSFDPAALGVPASYPIGQFPSVTTNAAGHTNKTLYNPVLGKVLTKTGPNGIQTCYGYDALGRQTSETNRCGTATPLVTTTQHFLTLQRTFTCQIPPCSSPPPTGFSPPNSTVVTVTTTPDGVPAWSYSDDQGNVTGGLKYAFDGGFIETTAAYNALGQVTQVAKPFEIATVSDQPSPSYTQTSYDSFNRVKTVTEPLGAIDASQVPKSTTITTTYNGSTIETDRQVSDVHGNTRTETRLETKNAMGKVASVSTKTESGLSTISYSYDADGNLTITQDPSGNQLQTAYDVRGRKVGAVDPDMGSWTYTQDGFGDLIQQIDPNARKINPATSGTTMTYDPLGRMLMKTDSTGTAQFVYDVAPGAGIGKLAAMVSAPDPKLAGLCTIPKTTVSGGNRAGKSYQYNAFGDVQEVDECADGATFGTVNEYDRLGRPSVIRYPVVNNSQLAVGYHYSDLGYLQYLTDESADYSVLWQAKTMNALGQVTDEQMRNGVETASTRSAVTGWLLNSRATAHSDHDKVIQNWTYSFDEIGNLLSRNRTDAVNTATSVETFSYDLTNRLTSSLVTTSAGYNYPESYAYDPLGNITQKAGNVYTYGGCNAGPHAVCSVAGGPSFIYDGDGNLTSSGSRSVMYNPSNKVVHIDSDPVPSQGHDTGSVDFMYGADGNRVVQSVTTGGVTSRTVYVGLGGTGKSLYERTTTPGAPTKHVHFIYAGSAHGGNAFALRVLDGSGTVNRYYSFDHLGSVTAMSDDQGHVSTTETSSQDATVLGYDAWGARRNPDGTAAPSASFDVPVGGREFTGQEQIPDVGLVNMNGRLYDPALGRFLSPDPNVQFVADLQSYNRYSYAQNNPLRYTDPTGYDLGGFFASFFSNPLNDIELAVSLVACTASAGACIIVGVAFALTNTLVAASSGEGLGRAALTAGIGLGIGIATGGIVSHFGGNAIVGLIAGSASAAVTTGIANVISHQKFFQTNVLGAALLSAAQGAATLGLQHLVQVSQASAGVDAEANKKIEDDLAKARAFEQKGDRSIAAGYYERAVREAIDANANDPALASGAKFDGRINVQIDMGTPEQYNFDAETHYISHGDYTIEVSSRALYQGAGYLRSTLYHEIAFHINLQFEVNGPVGEPQSIQDEIDAYNGQLKFNSHFGLDDDGIKMLLEGLHDQQARLAQYNANHGQP